MKRHSLVEVPVDVADAKNADTLGTVGVGVIVRPSLENVRGALNDSMPTHEPLPAGAHVRAPDGVPTLKGDSKLGTIHEDWVVVRK